MRPRYQVILDGADVPVTQITVSAPAGVASASVSLSLGNYAQNLGGLQLPDPSLRDTLIVKLGNAGELVTLVDTRESPDINYTVERTATTVTLTVPDRLGASYLIAPEEYGYFPESRHEKTTRLRTLLDFIYTTTLNAGTVTLFLPDVEIPRQELSPFTTYHDVAQGILGYFDPLVLPDPFNGRLFVLDPNEAAAAGAPYALTGATVETHARPEQPYPIVNQGEVRYVPYSPDGAPLTDGCGLTGSGSAPRRAGGVTVEATSDKCGTRQLSGEDALARYGDRVQSREVTERTNAMPQVSIGDTFATDALIAQLAPDTGSTISTTHYYLDFLNADGDVERSVEYRTVTTQEAIAGNYYKQRVAEATTDIYFLPESNYTISTGHKTVTHGLTRIPGVGVSFVRNLRVETAEVHLERWSTDGPSDWRVVSKAEVVKGWVLFESNGIASAQAVAPLEVAALNDTIDATANTSQYVREDVMISAKSEKYVGVGGLKNQTVLTTTEIDCIRGTVRTSTSNDLVGQPKVSGEPPVVTAVFKDDDLIAKHGARKRVAYDMTALGPSGLEVGAWRINRDFARSGTYRKTATISVPKPLATLHRGAYVSTSIRGVSKTYIVLGLTISVTGLDTATPKAQTVLECLEL